jgi:hypothetical protein
MFTFQAENLCRPGLLLLSYTRRVSIVIRSIICYQLPSATNSHTLLPSKPPNMCRSHTVRYACGCSGQTLELKKCDNRKEADRRPLRPLRPGEVDRWIGYYANLCTVGSEKSFEQRDYKCAICKRNDILMEKTLRETEEKQERMEGLTSKGKGKRKRKRKDVGTGTIREEGGEK